MELKFVICGLEHSGTTLVSDIFRQAQDIDSGFECGVLLGNSPKNFPELQPFYKNMLGGWEISNEDLLSSCKTDSFSDFYKKLYRMSGFYSPEVSSIFDKTPRYFQHLFACYSKVQVPFIATYKDPRSIVFSDFKRTGKNKDFDIWYEKYRKPKLSYLSSIYQKSYVPWKERSKEVDASQILCVSLEDVCLKTRETLELMFAHVGLEFRLRYLLLSNLRYSHTRLPQVSSRIPFEYLESLSISQIKRIREDFSSLQDWFYH